MIAISIFLVAAPLVPAQTTKVSIRSQVQDFDASAFTSVKPFPVSSVLPATCSVGQALFRTGISPGLNVHVCTSQDTWTIQGQATFLDPGFQVTRTSATVLTLGSDCSSAKPCMMRAGALLRLFSTPATLTLSGGVGTVFVYLSALGDLTVATTPTASLTLNCSGCQLAATTNDFPVDSLPLFQWSASSTNVWDTNGLDRRAILSTGRRFVAGSNIQISEVGGTVTIQSVGTMLPTGAVTNGNTLALAGPVPSSGSLFRLGPVPASLPPQPAALMINANSGYTGDMANWLLNGQTVFRWTAAGDFQAFRDGAVANWMGNTASTAGSGLRIAIAGTASDNRLSFGAGSSNNFLTANGLGKMALGTTAPTPTTADLLIQDATAGTGSTQLQVRAGAGQNQDLVQIQDASGSVLARFTQSGALQAPVTGDVTGNLTGNVTGNLTGNVTGDVTGNLTGNVTGNLTGNVTGNLTGNVTGSLLLTNGSSRPTCAVALRGTLWFTASASGTADVVEVCIKNAANNYVWQALY